MPASHFGRSRKTEDGLGSKRFYMAPAGIIAREELPKYWGLLEWKGREVQMAVKPGRQDLRSSVGLMKEMNLLLVSLRRVEVRIEPQTITDFLKWKNRMADYNVAGGDLLPGRRGELSPAYVMVAVCRRGCPLIANTKMYR
jgi:hypothetical protein